MPMSESGGPVDGAGEWSPLRLGATPAVERFPVDAFPPPVADFVRAISESIGCPPDFVGLPSLIVLGAAIGRSVMLELKRGYRASAALYGMNVGEPSSGKSPALDFAVKPLHEIDLWLHQRYSENKTAYDRALEAFEKAKGSDKPPMPTKPVFRSATLDDVTVEAVAGHLALNPRGLLVSRDEGSAWVAGNGAYKAGKGADRQFWLSALFGKPVRVDRKGNPDLEPLRIPAPFLSVIGNLPPSMLSALREGQGRVDGFEERILFAFPDPYPRRRWTEAGIPDDVTEGWGRIIDNLRRLPLPSIEGRYAPRSVGMTPRAKSRWVEFYDAYADDANDPGHDSTHLAAETKLTDFAARFALILHLAGLACDPEWDPSAEIPPVDLKAVEGAVTLWGYFRSHVRRVRWSMSGGAGSPRAGQVLGWLRRGRRTEFTVSELHGDLRWLADGPDESEAILRDMERIHAIRRRPEPSTNLARRGRKPTPTYEVNPEIIHSA